MSTPTPTLARPAQASAPSTTTPLVPLGLTHVLGLPLARLAHHCVVCGTLTQSAQATPPCEITCSALCAQVRADLLRAYEDKAPREAGKPTIGTQVLAELRAWLLVLYKAAQAERRLGLIPALEDTGRALKDAEHGVTSLEAWAWLCDDEAILNAHIYPGADDPLRRAIGALMTAAAWALLPERARASRNQVVRRHLERSREIVTRAASGEETPA